MRVDRRNGSRRKRRQRRGAEWVWRGSLIFKRSVKDTQGFTQLHSPEKMRLETKKKHMCWS